MFSALENETLEEVYNQKRFSQFSRIPIFNKEKEAVIGMVLKSDLLSQLILGHKEMTVVELKREVKSINEKELLGEFFKNRHKKREHLYIVEDQYKSVTGLVTLEDVLETILGYEILDETDQVADLQSLINKGK